MISSMNLWTVIVMGVGALIFGLGVLGMFFRWVGSRKKRRAQAVLNAPIRRMPVVESASSQPTKAEPLIDVVQTDDEQMDILTHEGGKERVVALHVKSVVRYPSRMKEEVGEEVLMTDVMACEEALTPKKETPPDQFMVFYVLSRSGETFSGLALLEGMVSLGLRYGDMRIFHRYASVQAHAPSLFAVASATEPGTFDLTQMANQSFSGVTFFCRYHHDEAWPWVEEKMCLMFQTAQRLSMALHGRLLDQRKELCYESGFKQQLEHLRKHWPEQSEMVF